MRRFFFVSIALAILAICLQFTALAQFGRGAKAIGYSIGVRTLSEQERDTLKIEASSYRTKGTVIGLIGLAFALASVGCVVLSARRHEPAWWTLTIALLAFYLMLQFAMA